MVETKKFILKSKPNNIIPICTNCLSIVREKSFKLEATLYKFFENAKRIRFCSKNCKKDYINNNPIVAHQIYQLKKPIKKKIKRKY